MTSLTAKVFLESIEIGERAFRGPLWVWSRRLERASVRLRTDHWAHRKSRVHLGSLGKNKTDEVNSVNMTEGFC